MKGFEEHIEIRAPAQRVYDYVSDFARHGEWAGNSLEVTQDGTGPVSVGTSFSTTAKQFGTQRERSTITAMESGSVFAWESTGTLGVVQHRFHVADAGGTTTLRKSATFARPTFVAKVAGRKLGRDVPAGLRSDLANIKVRLET
jgi:uncharacterized membrane protein